MKVLKISNTKRSLLILFLLSFSALVAAQENDLSYIRIRLNDVETPEEQQIINEYIKTKPGVSISRTDRRTDEVFAVFDPLSGLTPENFVEWIQSLGFQVVCFVHGSLEETPIKELICHPTDTGLSPTKL
jgi:hypothetical protein